jgi:hypothetical protein
MSASSKQQQAQRHDRRRRALPRYVSGHCAHAQAGESNSA